MNTRNENGEPAPAAAPGDFVLKPDPAHPAREMFLVHGTSLETAGMIMAGGFDPSYWTAGRVRFGEGCYFTDSPDLAVVYARQAAKASGSRACIVILRVVLGYAANGPDASQHRPPPGYHSVVVEPEGAARQYVVFRPAMAYPEYLVELPAP